MGSGSVRWVGPAGLALALALGGCDDFLDFDTLRCGNGVIEPAADEDCDGLPGGSPYRCGAPGTAAACRLICEDHAGCPEGWRCGRGVCTAAAGRFGQAVVTRLDGESVAVGDLDGDGRPDVVSNQRESLGVGYGRGDGAFEVVEAVAVPRANLPPAVGDADGDGRADVALLDGDGLMLYLGSESRTLDPLAAPEGPGDVLTAAVAVRATAPYQYDDVLLVSAGADGLRFAMRGKALDAAAIDGLFAGLDSPVVRAAQLDGDGVDGGEELLIGFANHGVVYALDLGCNARGCTATLRAELRLPGGRVATDSGPLAGDLNLDGLPDIVVQARRADLLFVAWGTADGFGPLTRTDGLEVAARGNLQPGVSALVDVAGDARPDLISRGTILMLDGPLDAPVIERLAVPRRPFTTSGVADVDGDGALDVYGLVENALEFMLTRDDGPFLQDSSGISDVTAVQAGDLDGNRFTDLVVRLADGGLEAYFGAPDGTFAGPTRMGAFEPSAAWTIARLPDGRLGDAADDLIVVDGGGSYAFAGSPQQVLTAPIGHDARPQGVAIGRFADGPGVYLGGRDQALQRADAVLTGADAAASDFPVRALPSSGCVPELRATGSVFRVVDWDGDGVQELLQYDQFGSEGVPDGVIQWLAVGPDAVRCRMVATLPGRSRPLAFGRADLDGDGADELVALLENIAGEEEAQRLVVWTIEEGATVAGEVWEADVRLEAGALVELGGRRRFLVASAGALLELTRVDGAFALEPMGTAPRAVVDALAKDMDGDGLDDLVFKTATSVLVMPQVTCGAREAWDGFCAREEAW